MGGLGEVEPRMDGAQPDGVEQGRGCCRLGASPPRRLAQEPLRCTYFHPVPALQALCISPVNSLTHSATPPGLTPHQPSRSPPCRHASC